MTAHPFHALTRDAQKNALRLCWHDALTLIPPRFDLISFIKRHPNTETDMSDLANTLLFESGWLFNHLGERIA